MIKLVAVDMDGTFLRDDRTYDKGRFLDLFTRMQKNHIHFVAASGSQYQRLRHEFTEVADNMDFISQNGAIVHQGDQLKEILPLSDKQVHGIIATISRLFAKHDVNQEVVSGLNGTYVNADMDPEALKVVKYYYRPVISVSSLAQLVGQTVNDQFTKIAINFAETVDFQQARTTLKAQLPDFLSSENSGFNTELIGLKDATKRSGIRALQKLYNIADDEVMTFGDNENDLSMLTMTPNSFAMKNADAHIQKAAGNVTQFDNNHDGVLAAMAEAL